MSFRSALQEQVSKRWWLLALAALEVLRQLHYYLQEQSKGYYRFWRKTLDREEAALGKINPHVRYRLGRLGAIPRVLLDPRGDHRLVHQPAG